MPRRKNEENFAEKKESGVKPNGPSKVKKIFAWIIALAVLGVIVWRVYSMFNVENTDMSSRKFLETFVSFIEKREIGRAVELCEDKEKLISSLEVLAGCKFVVLSVKNISPEERMRFGYFTKKGLVVGYLPDRIYAISIYVSKIKDKWVVREIFAKEEDFSDL